MTASAAETCVIAVFAKAPEPGQAKTRLIPRLGAQDAARLHARLVHQALDIAFTCAMGPVELWCSPARHAFFEQLARERAVVLHSQSEGNLGQRMCEAFQMSLARAARAILVGTDCPARTGGDLRRACAALCDRFDAVLGPVEDGGYHLIGLRRPHPELFEGIHWGTSVVLEQTRQRLQALRLCWTELPTRWDVDRSADVDRLLSDPSLASLATGLGPSGNAP